MDTSETYIKMCEKAEEIQKLFPKEEGDWYATSIGLDLATKEKPQFLRTHHVVALNKPIEYKFEEFTCWLPRQGQLQEMFTQHNLWAKTLAFEFFLRKEGKYDINEYPFQFTSMEQLWLAFVMHQKYNKVWDGEEWIEKL